MVSEVSQMLYDGNWEADYKIHVKLQKKSE